MYSKPYCACLMSVGICKARARIYIRHVIFSYIRENNSVPAKIYSKHTNNLYL